MLLRNPTRVVRLDLAAWVVLAAMVAARPAAAQAVIRLPARPVTITPTFEAERLPNAFEEDADLPLAMSTLGGGDTWVGCLAYSPDGTKLAVGDRPTRPLCTFLGSPPVNQNGGLIRIIDLATRRVVRTIRPAKKPRHEYEIVSVAYTPDGLTLIAHGKETWPDEQRLREIGYHVTAWDAATGEMGHRLDSLKLDDWKLPTFSRDASTFATLMNLGVRVWGALTGREWAAPKEAPLEPSVLAFSPDAKTIAMGEKNGDVGLWEVATGRFTRFPGHRKNGNAFEVSFLAFSPDGRMLARGGRLTVQVEKFLYEYTSEITLLDLATRTERATIAAGDKHSINSAAFSPDGTTIAAVVNDSSNHVARGVVKLWDAATGRERASVGRSRPADFVAFSADGSSLVTADREWIVIRDPRDGRERIELHQGWFTAAEATIALAPDGLTLASSNGRFKLWDLRAAAAPPTVGGHRFGVTCLAYAPDGRTLASGSFDRTVKLWDVANRSPRITLVGHRAEVERIAYSPDGRAVASVDAAGEVRIWDAATGACRRILEGPDGPPQLLAFAPDGQSLGLIVWGGRHLQIRRWDAATGNRRPFPDLADKSLEPLAFSPDGGLYVAGDQYGAGDKPKIQIRHSATADLLAAFAVKATSADLLLSADGQTVFQRTPDSSIVIHRRIDRVWKTFALHTVKERSTVLGGAYAAGKRMTATPNGQRLAVIIDDSVQILDTASARPIAVLRDPEETFSWLAFSPNGKALATGRTNGDILIHDLDKAAAAAAKP